MAVSCRESVFVEIASEMVECFLQIAAIAQALLRDLLVQGEIRQSRAVARIEGAVSRPQENRVLVLNEVMSVGQQADIGRNGLTAANLADDRTENRPKLLGCIAFEGTSKTGHQFGPVVIAVIMHIPYHGELVRHLCEQRQMLANLDAGDAGPDRLEFAANVARRLGFEIKSIDVGWTAGQ